MSYINISSLNTKNFNNDELISIGHNLLGEENINEICSKNNEKAIKESLGGRILLSSELYKKNIDLKKDIILKSPDGKPILKENSQIHFNISHSKEMILCTISDSPIGCDIEKMGYLRINIADRFFHEKEYKKISSETDDNKKKELFYKYWTAKESYIKSIGTGLRTPLNSFIVDLDNNKIENQNIRHYDTINDYMICICSELNNFPDKIIEYSKEMLY